MVKVLNKQQNAEKRDYNTGIVTLDNQVIDGQLKDMIFGADSSSGGDTPKVDVDVTVNIPIEQTNSVLSSINSTLERQNELLEEQGKQIKELAESVRKQKVQNKMLSAVNLLSVWISLALKIRNGQQFNKYLNIEKSRVEKLLEDMLELVDELDPEKDEEQESEY